MNAAVIGCRERLVHGVRRQERVVHDIAYPQPLTTSQTLNCRNVERRGWSDERYSAWLGRLWVSLLG
ncbi:hypothetical protein DMA12_24800 [Amycolatopsis balhimycina DSM 5908]|uniref:Uncharacterized protein n=1 Tax=Amycolatopsis balhimycina DSM 5908 TaxID=1081091 RepID=A0A428WDQ6_AMYBA|nr:hypothetical protein DMA12_24800 [Amycolatopsis balhimycina DSM 5908]